MNISKVNYSALNCMKSNCTGLNVFSMGKKKANMEKSVMDAMVLWYDLKKQGATNEGMQANPVLVDHSGNGRTATCQNFAWSGMSGIGGYYFTGLHAGAANQCTYELTGDKSKITILTAKGTNAIHTFTNSIAVGDTYHYKVKVTGLDVFKQSFPNAYMQDGQGKRIKVDGVYDVHGAATYNYVSLSLHADQDIAEGSSINITIEQLPLYPNAIVSDGVDDKITCPAFKLGKDYTLLFDVTWMDGKASAGLVKSENFFIYNNVSAEDKLTCFINRSSKGVIVPNTIIGVNTQLDFIDKDFSIIEDTEEQNDTTGNTSIIMIGYNGTNFTTMALRKLLLFDRALSLDEIKWVKNNLMEETV